MNNMEKFLEEIAESFEVEDFTGNLGVLLDENAEGEQIESALEFAEKLYKIAEKYTTSL